MHAHEQGVHPSRLCSTCDAINLEHVAARLHKRHSQTVLLSDKLNAESCDLCRVFQQNSKDNEGSQSRSNNDTDGAQAGVQVRAHWEHGRIAMTVFRPPETISPSLATNERAIAFEAGLQRFQVITEDFETTQRTWERSVGPPRPAQVKITTKCVSPFLGSEFFEYARTHLQLLRRSGGDHNDNDNDDYSSPNLQAPGPIWLIDCDKRIVIKASGKRWPSFVALSYVWGQAPSSPVMSAFHWDDGPTRLPDSLPQTIADAIDICKRLRMSFLWVDQYCINQADEIAKAGQIQMMGEIYFAATVTIVAACTSKAGDGIAGVSVPRKRFTATLQGQVFFSQRTKGNGISNTKWASRGWTMQEGLLSRQRLIITEEGVILESLSGRWRESSPRHEERLDAGHNDQGQIPTVLFGDKGLLYFPPEVEIRAFDIIQEFTRRQLTSQRDRLNAVEGILNTRYGSHEQGILYTFQKKVKLAVSYFDSDSDILIRALCFVPEDDTTRLDFFSSFSWTGWTGPVSFPLKAERLSSLCSFKLNPVPRVGDTNKRLDLVMKARVVDFKITKSLGEDQFNVHVCFSDESNESMAFGTFWDDQDPGRSGDTGRVVLRIPRILRKRFSQTINIGRGKQRAILLANGEHASYVWMRCCYCILLVEDAGDGTFERIGLALFSDHIRESDQDAPREIPKTGWEWFLRPESESERSEIRLT